MRRDGIPSVEDEQKAFFGDVPFVDYTKMATHDIRWWRKRLEEIVQLTSDMLSDMKSMKLSDEDKVPSVVLRGFKYGEARKRIQEQNDQAWNSIERVDQHLARFEQY